ncbi:hypothetical protein AUJ17_01205 [Candidatus Micrarchaeota archaeon CG1_02_47_40]|nr:MAG: hypothetical protein AUJ17_01205 [Candidatus Micrarchaeota archaeon CG1_02_47_40]
MFSNGKIRLVFLSLIIGTLLFGCTGVSSKNDYLPVDEEKLNMTLKIGDLENRSIVLNREIALLQGNISVLENAKETDAKLNIEFTRKYVLALTDLGAGEEYFSQTLSTYETVDTYISDNPNQYDYSSAYDAFTTIKDWSNKARKNYLSAQERLTGIQNQTQDKQLRQDIQDRLELIRILLEQNTHTYNQANYRQLELMEINEGGSTTNSEEYNKKLNEDIVQYNLNVPAYINAREKIDVNWGQDWHTTQ